MGSGEGGRLAGPGLGDAAEVSAAEDLRNGLGLDRGGCRITRDSEGSENRAASSKSEKLGNTDALRVVSKPSRRI